MPSSHSSSSILYLLTVDSYIIFANRKDIRKLDENVFSSSLTGHRKAPNATVLIDQLEDATAIDFDYEKNLLFWTDLGFETIKGFGLDDGHIFDVITTGIESPESLACDWITKKLYWVDSETNHIDVSNYDGSHRTVLFWKDLDQPRTIVLVPSDGIMFWSDWGETPKIEKASMDGNHSTREIIIKNNISWPNGLTVDYVTKTLYFADAKLGYISSCDFEGRNFKTVVSNVSQIFALTLTGNILYWTEMQNTNSIKNHHSFKNGIHFYDRSLDKLGVPYINPHQSLSPLGITVFDVNRQPKSYNPCAHNNGGCSHLCLLSSNSEHYSCACPTGIKLELDGKTCHSSAQKLLLLARRLDIRRISLDTNDYTPVVLPIKNIKHAVTLDYDPIEGKVYWTDDELLVIKRASLNGSQLETIISTELMYPDGLAIDWIARNIYWTDAALNRIEAARLNGTSRKIIISKDIDQPRAIVVHPLDGIMFWSDWGVPGKIERASLDGSDRIVIVNTSLAWPNGLAIDYELSHIYWCDAKTKAIEMSRFDGSNRRTIAVIERSHMYDLTLMDEFIYWTDWTRRTVEKTYKLTGSEISIVIENLPDLMGLKAVSISSPNGTNPCGDNNGNCSHLCFNRPHQRYVCGCPDGSSQLEEDGRTCTKSDSYLIFLDKIEMNRVSLKTKKIDHLPIIDIKSASAIDIDIENEIIYWADPKNHLIARSHFDGSKFEIILQNDLGTPQDISFDWISENLYWINSEEKRIEVSRSNGIYRKIIFQDRHSQLNSLVVNPVDGYLFWSDRSNAGKIIISFLDGNRRKILVDSVGSAISLTIDYGEKILYWISMEYNIIMSSYFNGNSRTALNFENSMKPISIAINDEFIYVLNQNSDLLEYFSKKNHSIKSILDQNDLYASANQMILFDRSNQKGWNFCADQNGGCEQLCFVKPVQKNNVHESYCGCTTHYFLDGHESKKCSRKFS
ncbi:low-density lipoprotein receptor-related protein 6-like protein [Sarcoptes scabiei]|uniref:Low-density lipoprotein receptor-related protein 6-like protein n=1 Tax=Sarcoptes scabiei TaxID=52283 RepID=A0A132A5D1_SARSC|nr:low-density lipoprotein receptor-related protein 6-like protein [Sarcoptes scabiei]